MKKLLFCLIILVLGINICEGAGQFSGSGEYAACGDVSDVEGSSVTAFTVWARIKINSFDRSCRIINKWNEEYDTHTDKSWDFAYNKSQQLQAIILKDTTPTYSSAKSSSTLDTTSIHTVAVTWSGGNNYKFYIDGEDAGTTVTHSDSSTSYPQNVSDMLILGANRWFDRVDSPCNATIYEVAYWNTALSASEIASLGQASRDIEFQDNFNDNSMSSDWSTYDCDDTSGTSFIETGGQMEIDADGTDVWDPYDDYGVVYLDNIISGDFDVRVKVTYQENTGVWAKAGLMVRNDITGDGTSLGYVVVNATPSNGWQMMWDNDSDGKVEANSNTGTMSYPSWVRIVRSGNTFTGYYSTDGTTWNSLGSASPSSPNSNVDIGLYVCSTSSGTLSLAKFDDFILYGAKSYTDEGSVYAPLFVQRNNLKHLWVLNECDEGELVGNCKYVDIVGGLSCNGVQKYAFEWDVAPASVNRLITYSALWGPASGSTISYDTSASTNCNDPDGTTCSMNYTIGSGSNRLLVVGFTTEKNATHSSVTYNGVNLTKIGERTDGSGTVSLWYMLDSNLPSAGTYTLTVTSASTVDDRNIVAVSVSGVYQGAPYDTSNYSKTNDNHIVGDLDYSEEGSWAFVVVHSGEENVFLNPFGYYQVERQDVNGNSSEAAISANSFTVSHAVGEDKRSYP